MYPLSLSLFFWDSYNVNISKPDVALESLKLCLLKKTKTKIKKHFSVQFQ